MNYRVKVFIIIFVAVSGTILGILSAFKVSAVNLNESPEITEHKIFLPLSVKNNSEPFSVTLTLHSPVIAAGETLLFTATVVDDSDNPIYDSFFDVFVEISGHGGHYTAMTMTSHLDGTYTGVFSSTGSGAFTIETLIFDNDSKTKWDKKATADFEILPLEINSLALKSISPLEVQILARDLYLNPIPIASVGGDATSVLGTGPNCWTASGIFNVVVTPDPDHPAWMWRATVRGNNYGVDTLFCTHPGVAGTAVTEVGFPPLVVTSANEFGDPSNGFMIDSFFDVFFELTVPDGHPSGWKEATGFVQLPPDSPVFFVECQPVAPDILVNCIPNPSPDGLQILWTAVFSETGGVVLDSTPFKMIFSTPASGITDPILTGAKVVLVNLATPLPGDPPLIFDPTEYEFWWNLSWILKPTKKLKMHVYLVDGAATEQQVRDDVAALENGFNLNAYLCNCGFFIEIELTITKIPKADWDKIDEDDDGLDRYDSNGDGDYADPGDNNDLLNAMNEGYFDVSANTENVYYVPGIRGGALGTTYWPNGQIAIDNSKDGDNLTLMHEKVHELDLRKDGDFDVNDSPDDAGNAQGARNPGNVMNYDNTGSLLTPAQCEFLE